MDEQTEEIAELQPHAFSPCVQVSLFQKEACQRCGVLRCHRFEGDAIHRVGNDMPAKVAA